MWPTYVDASGCEHNQYRTTSYPSDDRSDVSQLLLDNSTVKFDTPESLEKTATNASLPARFASSDGSSDKQEEEDKMELSMRPTSVFSDVKTPALRKNKRQLDKPVSDWDNEELPTMPSIPSPIQVFKSRVIFTPTPVPECIPHGLGSTNVYGSEEFTLGSMADSTYEYFPKEYILLGGLVDQYREMFEWSMDVAKENLLFRPMIPDEEREVLISGAYRVVLPMSDNEPGNTRLINTGSHLTCFVGGMFALGAKVFNRPEDLEIAKKLTDGCVWAYEMTTTGIMPESFVAIPCESRTSCPWNESRWWDELDPNQDWREQSYIQQMEIYEDALADRRALEAKEAAEVAETAETAAESHDSNAPVAIQTASPVPPDEADTEADGARVSSQYMTKIRDKRQVSQSQPTADQQEASISTTATASLTSTGTATRTTKIRAPLYSPVKPPTHEEYVKKRIEEDRVPPGISYLPSSKYHLRPEALESVFYLYRITGSPYWREKGWNMTTSILRHTETEFGHSTIDDVTKTHPKPKDSMESFWLAETLKYAWLLFEEEDRWSLDHWVFNTEAHPFRRPDAPKDAN